MENEWALQDERTSAFVFLPEEVLLNVCSHLERHPISLARLGATCRRLHRIVDESEAWEAIAEQYVHVTRVHPELQSEHIQRPRVRGKPCADQVRRTIAEACARLRQQYTVQSPEYVFTVPLPLFARDVVWLLHSLLHFLGANWAVHFASTENGSYWPLVASPILLATTSPFRVSVRDFTVVPGAFVAVSLLAHCSFPSLGSRDMLLVSVTIALLGALGVVGAEWKQTNRLDNLWDWLVICGVSALAFYLEILTVYGLVWRPLSLVIQTMCGGAAYLRKWWLGLIALVASSAAMLISLCFNQPHLLVSAPGVYAFWSVMKHGRGRLDDMAKETKRADEIFPDPRFLDERPCMVF